MNATYRLISSLAAAAMTASVATDWNAVSAQNAAATNKPAANVDPCRVPANKIVAENCKPGNPREEWDVYNAGDPDIQGFTTDMSVNAGETVYFKIKSHSPKYRIEIYRMGWYGGQGARLIQTVTPSVQLPQGQPECRVHSQTRLVDCGNWNVSASWPVPRDAVSGVYVARLVREDDEPTSWRSEETGQPPIEKPAALPHAYGALGLGRLRDALKEKRASHIVFVVRDDAGRSEILVQTSDPTWVAFNRYGGSSLYGSSPGTQGALGGGAGAIDLPSRAYMVSYNRPLVNRGGGALQDQFFNSEYPLVRWLERNGFDVGYFAGVDTDRRGAQLRNHRVFMTAGHDAYWTPEQRRNIEAARAAGVHLAFLSSSTGMWRARWEPSNDGTNTPYRTLTSYKETHADGKIDSVKEDWTGTWRDSRVFNPIGPQPENSVVGTLHTVGGFRNDPLTVPFESSKLPFWRNTSVATLKEGQTAILGKGILGYEWDQDVDNGFRPAGLVHLSTTTIDNVAYLQDLGTVYDSGTATHHLTMYRAPSGALVFSAGTAQYSWGLDNYHTHWTTGGSRVRPEIAGPVKDIQQATINLLADMGVQPANLQQDLVRAQASGPTAAIAAPSRPQPAQTTAGIRNPCGAPANKIVAENCKPGNPPTEWDINGMGDPTIQGFATDISYRLGETAEFKVRTSSTRYRVDIYRMGYYGGLGARLIATLRPPVSLPQAQPECVTDWSVRLYDCGNWAVSASWTIPADAISGVYVARLVREDPAGATTWRVDNAQQPGAQPIAMPHAYGAQGLGTHRSPLKEPRASHIVFIVRDDSSRADIVMQTSDPTWQAYNTYGLGSVYNGLTSTGASGGRVARAYKVSFNRPFVNRTANAVNQFFNAEYALTRWLERNGYDVTYLAGVDSDRHGERLKQHKLFISIGHDEYWSGEHRRNVEAARDAGVNLAFMSGNEVFWKTRYEPSIDGSKTPYRTLVVYKETHSYDTPTNELQPGKKIDPMRDVWTGTWRDSSSFNPEGAQPENALTGTIFTVNANRQDPLAVPGQYARLRFWRNTDVAKLGPADVAVLGNGLLGHEWDEDLDNGFRPAGLIRLSETTLDGVPYPTDWGTVYDSGTATHTLTLYRARSGALVFGAGCVQYAWALDDFHDNPTAVGSARANPYSLRAAVDPYGPVKALQQATVNLFADMGVQPRTLQTDLVPATASQDKARPLSKILMPPQDATLGSGIVTISGTAADNGGGIVAGVEVSTDAGKTWHPASGTEQWTYRWAPPAGTTSAAILSRASDDSLNMEIPGRPLVVQLRTSTTSR